MSEEQKKICWSAPSNIALVKYWGKRAHQLPENCSLSFTLEKSVTTTCLTFQKKQYPDKRISVEYFFHSEQHLGFERKTEKLLYGLLAEMPILADYKLLFHSENNFPHSTGIASSASSMSAMALCLVSMEEFVNQKKLPEIDFFRRASFISRMGSGSASRSVFGGVVTWGENPVVPQSSDEYATPFPLPAGSRLNKLMDIILIVSSEEKKVSSSSGHALMSDHPYHDGRIVQANNHIREMSEAIRSSDYQTIASIAENEALSLHALLMTSSQNGLLLKPQTISIIEEIRKFRTQTGFDLFFTIDAGPNVHLIYFEDQREMILPFVHDILLKFCEDGRWIDDKIGSGPKLLTPEILT